MLLLVVITFLQQFEILSQFSKVWLRNKKSVVIIKTLITALLNQFSTFVIVMFVDMVLAMLWLARD